MKFLHTGDWHMNDALGRVDRTEDIFRSIEAVAGYLEEHQVDVLLVAGDLFSERSRPEQTRAAIERLNAMFGPFLKRGGTMVAIPGNHDSEIFFDTLRNALALVAPAGTSVNGVNAGGSLYLCARPRLITLSGPAPSGNEEVRVQIAMLPYPTSRCYLDGARAAYSSIEEKHRVIQDAFTGTLEKMRAGVDPSFPSILLSHVHVRGVATHTLYRVSEVEDVVFDPSDIPTNWAYVAYGHIHKAQEVLVGAPHVRYCGSAERLDFAERDDEKSCALFEIGPSGLVGEVQLLPLPTSTMHRVVINDARVDLPKLKQLYPDHATALVQYELHWQPGRDSRDEIARQVNEIFPRWYAREFKAADRVDVKGLARESVDLHDVAGNVRRYLDTQLVAAPSRDEVIKLAEEFLAARGDTSPANVTAEHRQVLADGGEAEAPAALEVGEQVLAPVGAPADEVAV
jgi:exonuclease SbcD